MSRRRSQILATALILPLLALGAACGGAGGEAVVHLELPERSESGRTLASASEHEQPYFEIRATSADLETAVAVTGTPGETVRAVVPAGSGWTFTAALYPDASATAPTHRGNAGPYRLEAGEQRRVVIDVYPIAVPPEGYWKVVAGAVQTCGITRAENALHCWGWNLRGSVGVTTSTVSVRRPVTVATLGTGVTAVAVGTYHACAVDGDDGSVWCWGDDRAGQLGQGTTGSLSVDPVEVSGLPDPVVELAAGTAHTCARTATGEVWCWGDNVDGQLGGGIVEQPSPTPVHVAGLGGPAVGLAGGASHNCVRLEDGSVECWGAGFEGQLGHGVLEASLEPVRVSDLGGRAAGLGLGRATSCAWLEDGRLRCWGGNQGDVLRTGELQVPVTMPTTVESGGEVVGIALGDAFACAMHGDGATRCWGANAGGQLGHGRRSATFDAPAPVENLPAGSHVVSAGMLHACATDTDGRAACWGHNGYAQLGDGSGGFRLAPARVGDGFREVAASGNHTCAVGTDGTAACWGENASSQLGGRTLGRDLPGTVAGLTAVSGITAGPSYTCAVSENASAWCWGRNGQAQLGLGYTSTEPVVEPAPVQVTLGTDAALSRITAGHGAHTCGMGDPSIGDNSVYCWGDNFYSQALPDGGTSSSPVLWATVAVGADFPPVDVSVGGVHSLFIDSGQYSTASTDGAVNSWGYNGQGQLGLSSLDPNIGDLLGLIDTIGELVQVTAGRGHSCAIRGNESLWCWGDNSHGQLGLGDGVPGPVSSPALVGPEGSSGGPLLLAPAGTTGWRQVSAGIHHTCGIKTDGTLWCWGRNTGVDSGPVGQLGIAEAVTRATSPRQVGSATDWVQVSAGDTHTCAVKTDETLWCWGGGPGGWLGLGDTWAPAATPVGAP